MIVDIHKIEPKNKEAVHEAKSMTDILSEIETDLHEYMKVITYI